MLDAETKFLNAIFLERKSTTSMWRQFFYCWTLFHIGFPKITMLDRAWSFNSEDFRNKAKEVGVDMQFREIEFFNYMRKGEGYHRPLRLIFNILKTEYKTVDDKHILRISIKGTNGTMGTKGLVPSLLLFGILPPFPFPKIKTPNKTESSPPCAPLRLEWRK